MRTFLTALLFCAALSGADTEKKIKMKDLPPAVQAAVKDLTRDNAVLAGLAKEVENGKTMYEAELKVNGHTKDVTIDETGKIVTTEEEVSLASLPTPAREAMQKAVGKRKLARLEAVTKDGTTYYEGLIKSGFKKTEVKIDPAGNTVK